VVQGAPDLGAQPLLVQVIGAVGIGLGALLTAYMGYRKRVEREPPGAAQTVVAAFPDLTTIRQLTDQCRILCEHVAALTTEMSDHTHYLRNKIEVDRELCQRLRENKEETRELREELARQRR
jgi:hypothetical protein